jgi:hypothetical protein
MRARHGIAAAVVFLAATACGSTTTSADNRQTRFTFADFGMRADIAAPPPGDVVTEDSPFLLSSLYLTQN